MQHTPPCDKHEVGVHLQDFEVFRAILGEVHNPPLRQQCCDG